MKPKLPPVSSLSSPSTRSCHLPREFLRLLSCSTPFLANDTGHNQATILASSASSSDPRVRAVGRRISTDYARPRDQYAAPKHPIVLAHGLLGFSELRPPKWMARLQPIQYWHGIKEALVENARSASPSPSSSSSSTKALSPASSSHDADKEAVPSVVSCTVPPSGSIAERAEHLARDISRQLRPRGRETAPSGPITVNIIAHSMGGLDARYLTSVLRPAGLRVASLTTIATPHRGSYLADLLLEPPAVVASASPPSPRLRTMLARLLVRARLDSAAFTQLNRRYLAETFNPAVPDAAGTRYFSFGASIAEVPEGHEPGEGPPPAVGRAGAGAPGFLSPFRLPWGLLEREEGPNDGLVSVASSRWGEYRGTLIGVSHLDLINWTNRVGWTVKAWVGVERNFNAVALYLDIADMLAKEGL